VEVPPGAAPIDEDLLGITVGAGALHMIRDVETPYPIGADAIGGEVAWDWTVDIEARGSRGSQADGKPDGPNLVKRFGPGFWGERGCELLEVDCFCHAWGGVLGPFRAGSRLFSDGDAAAFSGGSAAKRCADGEAVDSTFVPLFLLQFLALVIDDPLQLVVVMFQLILEFRVCLHLFLIVAEQPLQKANVGSGVTNLQKILLPKCQFNVVEARIGCEGLGDEVLGLVDIVRCLPTGGDVVHVRQETFAAWIGISSVGVALNGLEHECYRLVRPSVEDRNLGKEIIVSPDAVSIFFRVQLGLTFGYQVSDVGERGLFGLAWVPPHQVEKPVKGHLVPEIPTGQGIDVVLECDQRIGQIPIAQGQLGLLVPVNGILWRQWKGKLIDRPR